MERAVELGFDDPDELLYALDLTPLSSSERYQRVLEEVAGPCTEPAA